ncbi:DNA gyrase inhibitor YacG [Roseomonas sp. HF4]|uniref:DNA gyrase inhibitor YacG n=1 Tax=Roseomonas sp. HF4 TaxID=2562313 RepID=UPI0010C0789F|nr:DNA gyrase inhibitor YacG [Roseomonas sp. HF4]
MTADAKPPALPRCPICRRRASAEARPFCSARCAQVDLGRWLTGGYAIPGEADEPGRPEDEDGP